MQKLLLFEGCCRVKSIYAMVVDVVNMRAMPVRKERRVKDLDSMEYCIHFHYSLQA